MARSFSSGYCTIHRCGFTGRVCPRCRRAGTFRGWVADTLERLSGALR